MQCVNQLGCSILWKRRFHRRQFIWKCRDMTELTAQIHQCILQQACCCMVTVMLRLVKTIYKCILKSLAWCSWRELTVLKSILFSVFVLSHTSPISRKHFWSSLNNSVLFLPRTLKQNFFTVTHLHRELQLASSSSPEEQLRCFRPTGNWKNIERYPKHLCR